MEYTEEVKNIVNVFSKYNFSDILQITEEELTKSLSKIKNIGRLSPKHFLLAYAIIDKFDISTSLYDKKKQPIHIFDDSVTYGRERKNMSEIITSLFSHNEKKKDFDLKRHKIEVLSYVLRIITISSTTGNDYDDIEQDFINLSPDKFSPDKFSSNRFSPDKFSPKKQSPEIDSFIRNNSRESSQNYYDEDGEEFEFIDEDGVQFFDEDDD